MTKDFLLFFRTIWIVSDTQGVIDGRHRTEEEEEEDGEAAEMQKRL